MHTPLCRHAAGTPVEYARAGLEKGLSGVCFTDHAPMPAWFDPASRMRRDELPRYLEMVLEARDAVGDRLEVLVGLEADFHPGTERWVADLVDEYAWDYVIGSVHYLGAWPLDHPDFTDEYARRDPYEIYDEYYRLVTLAAGSGLFDSIGHLDLPKKFGHRMPDEARPLAEQALDVIAGAGLALDLNTAGWRKPVGEPYPSAELLRAAFERGIPVVLGSDAHQPEEVGWRFDEAIGILRSVGYGAATVYRGRDGTAVELPGA